MSRKPKYDLVTIGDATWDAVVTGADTKVLKQRGKKFLAYPYGEKVHLDDAYFSHGGGAANVAVSAARLGAKTAYCGSLGTDRIGQDIREHFKDEKVDASLAVRDPKHVSALAVVLTAPDGDRTILLYDGSNRDLGGSALPWNKLFDTRWLYLPSLPGAAGKLYNRLAREAGQAGVKVALNPGAYQIKRGTRGLHSALENCDVLLMNDDEAAALLKQRGHAAGSLKSMLKKFHAITGGIIVITRGDRGAVATDGLDLYDLPVLSKRRVNSVGAGDAFGSTLVVALQKGKPLAEALVYASLNASSVVTDYTAQEGLQTWRELSAQFKRTKRYRPKVTQLVKRQSS
jgi:sugar/nucleoside kinase (ribokinase family)